MFEVQVPRRETWFLQSGNRSFRISTFSMLSHLKGVVKILSSISYDGALFAFRDIKRELKFDSLSCDGALFALRDIKRELKFESTVPYWIILKVSSVILKSVLE